MTDGERRTAILDRKRQCKQSITILASKSRLCGDLSSHLSRATRPYYKDTIQAEHAMFGITVKAVGSHK